MTVYNVTTDGTRNDFLEYFYAYLQARHPTDKIVFDDRGDKNILFLDHIDMPEEIDCTKYDLVIIHNDFESLWIIDERVLTLLEQPNVKLLVQDFIHEDHPYYDKILSFPDEVFDGSQKLVHRKYLTSYLYTSNTPKKYNLTLALGANRSYRNFLYDKLHLACDNVRLLSPEVVQTFPTGITQKQDKDFIEMCNRMYKTKLVKKTGNEVLLNNKIRIGFTDEYMIFQPHMIDDYVSSWCMIYPETGFYNHSASITQKTVQCLKSRTHILPYGGAFSNDLLERVGYTVVTKLCPDSINDYDSELDHCLRIEKLQKCVEYLAHNPTVFHSSESKQILDNNFNNFIDMNLLCDRVFGKIKETIDNANS